MARPARPWFRFYVEAMSDPKLRTLAPTLRWFWVAVLGAARQSPEPGYLLVSDDVPHTACSLADYAAVKERDAKEGLDEFERRGMIEQDFERACWVVTHFSERQYEVSKRFLETESERESNPNDSLQSQRQKKRVSVSPPKDFVPTSEHDVFAREHALDLQGEVAHWLDWCEANGRTYKSVNAGFSTWLRQAVQFGRGGKLTVATLEDLSTPAPRLEPVPCPLELCDGRGFVYDEAGARPCPHRQEATA